MTKYLGAKYPKKQLLMAKYLGGGWPHHQRVGETDLQVLESHFHHHAPSLNLASATSLIETYCAQK